jgi:aspartyl-tRNA(Asn)/glutamyl-tRNA(Gln) amidotransferase subunit A
VFEDIEPGLARCLDEVTYAFLTLGAKLTKCRVPRMGLVNELHTVVRCYEATLMHGKIAERHRNELLESTIDSLSAGSTISSAQYEDAISKRYPLLKEFVSDVLGVVDVLFLPMLPRIAPTLEAVTENLSTVDLLLGPYAVFSRFASYLGIPSVSIPCSFSREGLPYAFQLCGRPFAEDVLFTVGRAFERTFW